MSLYTHTLRVLPIHFARETVPSGVHMLHRPDAGSILGQRRRLRPKITRFVVFPERYLQPLLVYCLLTVCKAGTTANQHCATTAVHRGRYKAECCRCVPLAQVP